MDNLGSGAYQGTDMGRVVSGKQLWPQFLDHLHTWHQFLDSGFKYKPAIPSPGIVRIDARDLLDAGIIFLDIEGQSDVVDSQMGRTSKPEAILGDLIRSPFSLHQNMGATVIGYNKAAQFISQRKDRLAVS